MKNFAFFLALALSLGTSMYTLSQKPELQEKQASPELKASMEQGKVLYASYCLHCHMENGEGIANTFPPLAKADYLMEDRERSIKQVIYGLEGEIVVNGVTYDGVMYPSGMNDEQVAHVLNFLRNSWGNQDLKIITKKEVAEVRAKYDD
jgi:mono/diheme cytochrome c family protein